MPASAIGPGRTASLALILLLTATVLLPAASQPAHADVASASTYLTDRAWSQVANGWGPVESDRSNGEQALGDGARLTLAGVGYDRGPRGPCRL